MKEKIFRSYDIRGIYPTEINENVAYKIGLAYGSILQEKYGQLSCIVSHDNRLSSPSLHDYLIKGLLETGINVIDYGLTTTPMNYFARHINNLYGIMITASHNPSNENGFKFSFDPYANARGEMIEEFKNYVLKNNFLKGTGRLIKKDIKEEYLNYLKNNINLGNKQLKIILDPANGSVTSILEDALNLFNLNYIIINGNSDGSFPNHHPDPSVSENLRELQEAVVNNNADVGFGFDGDGDRLGIVDNAGKIVSIEHYAILIIRKLVNEVNNKKFLYDAKCSDIVKDEIIKLNATPIICRTGSSYTQEKINKENIPFGIQYVGHIGFNDRYFSTESAIYAFLRLLEILTNEEKSLNELVSTLPSYFTSEEQRITSTDTKKLEVIDNIKKYCDKKNYQYIEIDGLRVEFKTGWAYVRASNTGPTINLRCEAINNEELDKIYLLFNKLIELFNN